MIPAGRRVRLTKLLSATGVILALTLPCSHGYVQISDFKCILSIETAGVPGLAYEVFGNSSEIKPILLISWQD